MSLHNSKKIKILCVDDEKINLLLIEEILQNADYNTKTAKNGYEALKLLKNFNPDIILLDIVMPGINGYQLCIKLQENEKFSNIPVIFVSALKSVQDIAKAFASGGVDYLIKPINKKSLLNTIEKYSSKQQEWDRINKQIKDKSNQNKLKPTVKSILSPDFNSFKIFLSKKLSSKNISIINSIQPKNIYEIISKLNITDKLLATYISEYLNIPFILNIDPSDIQLGMLSSKFCNSNNIVVINQEGKNIFILSNPFDWELIDTLVNFSLIDKNSQFRITNPEKIKILFDFTIKDKNLSISKINKNSNNLQTILDVTEKSDSDYTVDDKPIKAISNSILFEAITARSSDIHFEPKENKTIIRFRIDGDMREAFKIKKKTGNMILTRYKVMAEMDIAERRKPQDGSFQVKILRKTYQLRLATTSTNFGESLIIRILQPYAKAKKLSELGMSEQHVNDMLRFSKLSKGLILFVGPTGSGKTTTIYSLLNNIDAYKRSLISVEDPVEYQIQNANQQQINIKAGVTFETLLKSSVRQDPDILYIGEIRDNYSAKIALDFASTGHLSISTIHASNATSTIFRLERLGVDRKTMANSIVAIISQKLIKKLCSDCKTLSLLTEKEKEILKPFDEIPKFSAHPKGCPKCNNTGYYGREAVYEILEFTYEIKQMIIENKSISEIRDFNSDKNNLLYDHAFSKLKTYNFSILDIKNKIFDDESKFIENYIKIKPKEKSKKDLNKTNIYCKKTILVVEDDVIASKMIFHALKNDKKYSLEFSYDNDSALSMVLKNKYDLVISDINMSDFNGSQLLENINKNNIKIPFLFIISKNNKDDEIKVLKLGAVDYIKKPIISKIILMKVNKILKNIQ